MIKMMIKLMIKLNQIKLAALRLVRIFICI